MNAHLFLKRIGKLANTIKSPHLLKFFLLYRFLACSEHHQVLDDTLETVVDIGANRGQFALAAREWSPRAKVIAFEPLLEAATTFKRAFRRDAKVKLHQVAIGPKIAEASMHIAASNDSSSLLPISANQTKIFPGTHQIGQRAVKVQRLSDCLSNEDIESPALLKIDVQGYELEVLRGCENRLHQFSYLYVECSFIELYIGQTLAHDIVIWLQRRNWNLNGIYNIAYDRQGKSIQADFLFENSDFNSDALT